jgi:hypothetical protein
VINGLPPVAPQSGSGGVVILKLPESTSRCIAGIEASEEWVRIKFFNGRELHLEFDANPRAQPRTASLIFASLNDSQLLSLNQSGAQ